MKTIILNSTNYVSGSNNQFVYNFPSTQKFTTEDQIALAQCAIYNSTFNVSAALANNQITITWNANTVTTYVATLPDGYYSYADINTFLQFFCIANKLYVTTSTTGVNVYFISLATNSVRYAAQLNFYGLPTAAQATALGYGIPVGAPWLWPLAASTPQITFGTIFGSLIGFASGIYPSVVSASTVNLVSTSTPEVSIVQSYMMTCNLIRSVMSNPVNTFYSIPLTVGFGSLVIVNPPQLIWNDIDPAYYNQIVITFFDQNFNKITLNDPDLTITLVINKKENQK